MKCLACGFNNRETARFCENCGAKLNANNSKPFVGQKSASQNLLFFGCVGLSLLLVGAIWLLWSSGYIPVIVKPLQTERVVFTETPFVPTRIPTVQSTRIVMGTATSRPVQALPSTKTPAPQINRCELFDQSKMSVIYMGWLEGTPLVFYVKMKGGVLGLENQIAGDTQPWEYSVQIDNIVTRDCSLIQGYEERLYCNIKLPSGFAGTYRSFNVFVNGCEQPVYTRSMNDLPVYDTVSGSGSNSSSKCGDAPASTDLAGYGAWCSCNGGIYSTFMPAGYPPFGYCSVP